MTANDRDGTGCALCGRSTAGHEVRADDGRTFCSRGCLDVDDALGAADDAGPDPEESGSDPIRTDDPDSEGLAPGPTRTFFAVEGTSRPADEAFLESAAEDLDGVEAAEASYVTGTVRVDHDPDRAATDEVAAALSRIGYEADRRRTHGEGTADRRDQSGRTPGERKRSTEEALSMRYVVGVVFGSFMLLPYLVFLYPAYLGQAMGGGPLAPFARTLGNASIAAMLPLFAAVTGVVLFFSGIQVLRGGYVSLTLRRATTDLLVSLTVVSAYLYGVWALLLGRNHAYFDLTVVVAAGVTGVAFYEATVKRRALDRLTDLTTSGVEAARRVEDGGTTEVPVEDLAPDDRVLVQAGERVPVDGTLAEGECTVDESVVTGESLPAVKRAGDRVVGGSVVTADAAVIAVGEGAVSTIDRITEALWRIQSADHGVQRRADGLAARAFPVVVGAVLLAVVAALVTRTPLAAVPLSVMLAVVVCCPWALGLATPVSTATAIEEALAEGIVVFEDAVFERLRDVDVVALDKTGTLTTGEMSVVDGTGPEELLVAAGALERRASHPAAAAIAEAFAPGDDGADGTGTPGDEEGDPDDGASDPDSADATADGGSDLPEEVSGSDGGDGPTVTEFHTHATGVEGTVDDDSVLVGHPALFAARGWELSPGIEERVADAREVGRLPVVVGREGSAGGLVVLGDEYREGWADAVADLAGRGVEVVVLSGDDGAVTGPAAESPHVDRVFAGVPPEGKTAAIRRLGDGRRVAMVGDGTNDAPALAAADLGIALGSGTALASDAADVAVADDDLGAVTTAFDLSAAAGARVRRNTALAFVYNAIAIPVALAGLMNPLFAMVATLVTGGLIALNSARPLLGD